MKTLIITGTPRKKGHTIAMAEYLAGQLDGEVEWLSVITGKTLLPAGTVATALPILNVPLMIL